MLWGNEWNEKEMIPDLAVNLIAYHENYNAQDALLEKAVMLFNEKPVSGLNFCIKHAVIADKPTEISKFLLETNGLSKYAIGEYLSEPDNRPVLQTFTRSFDL